MNVTEEKKRELADTVDNVVSYLDHCGKDAKWTFTLFAEAFLACRNFLETELDFSFCYSEEDITEIYEREYIG